MPFPPPAPLSFTTAFPFPVAPGPKAGDGLRRAKKSLADRLDILERPRGLGRLFAWLFGKNKKPAPAEPVVEVMEESERD